MSNGPSYVVLDYSTGRILGKPGNLDRRAVLTVCRILMQLPTPSFDIMDFDSKKIVTAEFRQDGNGTWVYAPEEKIQAYPLDVDMPE